MSNRALKRYHAAVWDEPLIMELGRPGRRGLVAPEPEPDIQAAVGPAEDLIPGPVAPRRLLRPFPRCPSSRSSATTCTSPRRRSG